MKGFLVFLCCIVTAFVFVSDVSAQVVNIGQSSEWEATGFNNGRRIVRDSCSGKYFHYVWHSRKDPNEPPIGMKCDIFYACTDYTGRILIPPVNLTENLGFGDNRYPAIAIEYHPLSHLTSWQNYNALHLVWQAKKDCTTTDYYEIYHARIPVTCGSPVPPSPFTGQGITNLSQTGSTDSLVPAIAINRCRPNPNFQHVHVVWQEEDLTGGGPGSDILYTRSVDSGLNFRHPTANFPWMNLTNSKENSQVPSISCSLDTYYGHPLNYSGRDFAYDSEEVHISYNEETNSPSGTNVFYLRSPDDGVNWDRPKNVTLTTGGTVATGDGYSCIAADMQDYVHIVFMRDVTAHEPPPNFFPGQDPIVPDSFPGPDPGMYNLHVNSIIYWTNNPNPPRALSLIPGVDREFPTVALDHNQNISINWQEYYTTSWNFYHIIRIGCSNLLSPVWPAAVPIYGGWTSVIKDSTDTTKDHMFPNLAHKKAAMYKFPLLPPAWVPGFTEIWTTIHGHTPSAAISSLAKTINMLSNMY